MNKYLNGDAGIRETARRQLVDAAKTRVGRYQQQALHETEYYRGLAARLGIDPDMVTSDLEPLAEAPDWLDPDTGVSITEVP